MGLKFHFEAFLFFVLVAPLFGGLLAGLDRVITARLQRRVGPPFWQSYADVLKLLLEKRCIPINALQWPLVSLHLFTMILTGGLFFAGVDILYILFLFALSCLFLVLAAHGANSPFSFLGSQRELIVL